MNPDTQTTESLPRPWLDVLREQGRPMTWLARATGKAQSTVYAYRYGQKRPPSEWLDQVSEILGERVA